MGQERRFPCPDCGFEFHYTPDEPRLSAPCPKCGQPLIMPHGRFNLSWATPGPGASEEMLSKPPVFGRQGGFLSGDEWDKLHRRHATWAIRRWEGVSAEADSSPADRRAAEEEVYWAIWSFPAKAFILDGKRYKCFSRPNAIGVSVTPAPEKKPRKKSQ